MSVKTDHRGVGDYVIKDSGKRQEFETGAVRDTQENKGRFDLLPMFALMDLAKHFQAGCQKYGDRNWEKGIPISRFVDSGMRHLTEFTVGMRDENHLIAAIWNLFCAYDTKQRIERGLLPESLDDLPYPLADKVSVTEQDTQSSDEQSPPPEQGVTPAWLLHHWLKKVSPSRTRCDGYY